MFFLRRLAPDFAEEPKDADQPEDDDQKKSTEESEDDDQKNAEESENDEEQKDADRQENTDRKESDEEQKDADQPENTDRQENAGQQPQPQQAAPADAARQAIGCTRCSGSGVCVKRNAASANSKRHSPTPAAKTCTSIQAGAFCPRGRLRRLGRLGEILLAIIKRPLAQ